MKKLLSLLLIFVLLVSAFAACANNGGNSDGDDNDDEEIEEDEETKKSTNKKTSKPKATTSKNTQDDESEITDDETEETEDTDEESEELEETEESEEESMKETEAKATTFVATKYNVDEIKNAAETAAGSLSKWLGEVMKNGDNNNDPTENSVINSPYHTLKINGKTVPVYTTRCTTGSHSFAWIEVTSKDKVLDLNVKLTLSDSFGKCVVLPESRNVATDISGKTVESTITTIGSFTYTFAENENAEVTDPTFAPLTIMVTRATKLYVSDYDEVDIEPGYHDENELNFTKEKTIYNIKPGFHDISYIKLPSNSILNIENGAYIKVTERKIASGYSKQSAIQANYVSNVQIISKGLLDCGSLIGADDKNKHVVTVACSSGVSVEGLTIINSNTWTICAYNSSSININRNLLLGYRMYSDGIMMSECSDSKGTYNFVRTGDDGIEFKGTGSWGATTRTGQNCIYEYNDLWTDKGAGYCLTWESDRPMKNMIFRNNSVGFAQPTWTNRNTAIDCLMGTDASSAWSDVTFENIEIYHVISPNVINMQVQGKGGILENITFKNITVKSTENGVYAFRMHFSADGGSISGVTLDNVKVEGKTLTQSDVSNNKLFKNEAKAYFGNVTVK